MLTKSTFILFILILLSVTGPGMSQVVNTDPSIRKTGTNIRSKANQIIARYSADRRNINTMSAVSIDEKVGDGNLSLVGANSPFSGTIWLISSKDINTLLSLNPELTKNYFNNPLTDVGGGVPAGWQCTAMKHYTSFATFQQDISTGSPSAQILLYDNERWTKTPNEEKENPCEYMADFTILAHTHGYVTEMAPDQNLASPLNGITTYHGGESRNWQSYLRLGLGRCAAQTGTERYHVMAQPFESKWGPTPEGTFVGGEADFVDFVTQASLQARAVNPKLIITCGLSANTRYNPTSRIMYQESIDVRNIVNGFWLNIWGDTMGVNYLKLLAGPAPVRNSSVLFLKHKGIMENYMPDAPTFSKFNMGKMGDTLTFKTSQTFPAGTIIPPGPWEFQFWTDDSSSSAKLGLEFGYITKGGRKIPIIQSSMGWMPTVTAGSFGSVDSSGAFTTTTSTTLPPGGPYELYLKLTVLKPDMFNLLYGSTSTPTNLATPFVYSVSRPLSVPITISPDSMMTGVPRNPGFIWSTSKYAGKYEIQVASDSSVYSSGDPVKGFLNQNIVFDTTLTDTTIKLPIPLASLTKYYWHVRTLNSVDTSSYSVTWVFTTGTQIDAVNGSSKIPLKFSLSQNYPNPFNPSTSIQYVIPREGIVTLKIYDVLGREVQTLVSKVQEAGRYEVRLDGSKLSSGVYIYRLQSDDLSITKKMLLLK